MVSLTDRVSIIEANEARQNERHSVCEEKLINTEKRIDEYQADVRAIREIEIKALRDVEIKSLRDSRHAHNGMLQTHDAILKGIHDSVGNLADSVSTLSTTVSDYNMKANKLLWMVAGGVTAGSAVAGFVYLIGKTVFNLLIGG